VLGRVRLHVGMLGTHLAMLLHLRGAEAHQRRILHHRHVRRFLAARHRWLLGGFQRTDSRGVMGPRGKLLGLLLQVELRLGRLSLLLLSHLSLLLLLLSHLSLLLLGDLSLLLLGDLSLLLLGDLSLLLLGDLSLLLLGHLSLLLGDLISGVPRTTAERKGCGGLPRKRLPSEAGARRGWMRLVMVR